MPTLLVDTNPRPASSSDASTSFARPARQTEPASPDRPPVSPITPTALVPPLLTKATDYVEPPLHCPPPNATFRPQPASSPISESENTDAIALRSAISILQLQREKSKRDLKALQELKAVAVSHPQAFARSLQEQQAQASRAYTDVLSPTLSGLVSGGEESAEQSQSSIAEDVTGEEDAKCLPTIPPIPQPQNIVRCPPVNWAKYHIMGEPLDKLHEQQRKWPGAAAPPTMKAGTRAPPHSVAAPYSPFTDGLSQKPNAMQPAKLSKKPQP